MARIPERKQRGPVEIIEAKGIKIPVYYSPYRGTKSYLLAYYAEAKRKRERAPSIEAARKRAKRLIEELSAGTAHVATFTAKQTAMINEVVEMLQPIDVPLTEAVRQFVEARQQLAGQGTIAQAVRCFLEECRKIQLTPIKLPDLVEKFLHNLREQKKSRRYILDMQARLHKAAKSFTGLVGDIHATDINRWLLGMKHASGGTKNNYRTALATLLSFARQEGHLPRGIQTEAEFSTRYDGRCGEIGIYSSETLHTLLFRIEPCLMPFVAIGAFAGLRSAEIIRLEWQEIRFAQNVIEIKALKAKTASRRLVPVLPALAEWLAPVRKESGRVLAGVQDEFALAKRFKRATDAITGEDGKPLVKTIHNGLRHSFITYRMAVLKNAAEVALEAGNSPQMIFQHYRELATEAEGNAWFAVMPDKPRLELLKVS